MSLLLQAARASAMAASLAGCGPLADLRERLEPDLLPPVLLRLRARGTELELDFDEPPVCSPEDIRSVPALPVRV